MRSLLDRWPPCTPIRPVDLTNGGGRYSLPGPFRVHAVEHVAVNVEGMSASFSQELIALLLRFQHSLIIELELLNLGASVIEQGQDVLACFVLAHLLLSGWGLYGFFPLKPWCIHCL